MQRSPALERLIARAPASVRVADWRAAAFRSIVADGVAAMPDAATALCAVLGHVPGEWMCFATPVHLVAGMTDVTLSGEGVLDLSAAEAAALAADFNTTFAAAGARLVATPSGSLFCVFDRPLDVATCDPLDALGQGVFACQPTGTDAPRLRRWMSEIEMWLFDHAVNRLRRLAGLLPVTGLWLWNGARPCATPPRIAGWTAGRDPFLSAFGDRPAFAHEAGSGVAVCAARPGTAAWSDVERLWLLPATQALREGRIDGLTLSAGSQEVRVARGGRWKFWRRPRPWWESFAIPGSEPHGRQ